MFQKLLHLINLIERKDQGIHYYEPIRDYYGNQICLVL